MKAASAAMTQRPRDRVPCGSMRALLDPKRPDRANPPTNIWWSLFFWQHWHDLHALDSHWTDCQQGILCWGFKGVQEEIPSEEASTLQIGSVAFPHQDNAPSPQLHPLSQTIWPRWASRQFLTVSIVQTLLPVTFAYSPKLKGCRYETIEEMKEAVTKVIDMLTQEDLHGAFQKLLERYNKCISAGGDYFEGDKSLMCVLSIKMPIRKRSGNLFNDPRIYIFTKPLSTNRMR